MCCEQSFKSAPYICLLTRQYIFLTYVYCATDITPSTLSTRPTHPSVHVLLSLCLLSSYSLSLVLGRRFKLLSVEHLFHLLDLCRFFCSLFLRSPTLFGRGRHTALSLFLGQQKQVLYLLNMALFVAFASWLASICRSIALQMNRESKRQTLKSLIY